jgi:hypothetical protein
LEDFCITVDERNAIRTSVEKVPNVVSMISAMKLLVNTRSHLFLNKYERLIISKNAIFVFPRRFPFLEDPDAH